VFRTLLPQRPPGVFHAITAPGRRSLFCQAFALCSRTIAGSSEQFRAERTRIGGESTYIGSLPVQASPGKSHRASLSRQTMGIGWGISGEVEATPKASTAKGRGKCPWDALTVLIKNTASERLTQRSTCHDPCKKARKGTRHVELCSRRSVLITTLHIEVRGSWTGARRGVRA
jgi:hypothetical protein